MNFAYEPLTTKGVAGMNMGCRLMAMTSIALYPAAGLASDMPQAQGAGDALPLTPSFSPTRRYPSGAGGPLRLAGM